MIERQVRHLVRLVDDLLDVSRIARGDDVVLGGGQECDPRPAGAGARRAGGRRRRGRDRRASRTRRGSAGRGRPG